MLLLPADLIVALVGATVAAAWPHAARLRRLRQWLHGAGRG